MKKIRAFVRKIVFVTAFAGCILAILYPLISNYLYSQRQDRIITEYTEMIEQTDDQKLEEERRKCVHYNRTLLQSSEVVTEGWTGNQYLSGIHADRDTYEERLNLNGSGVMGYVIIPAIDVYLAINHGTTKEVLDSGVGHLPESSLPVGGENCHAVLTGHTGSTNKTIFTDLEKLEIGDHFYLYVLGEFLAYQVDRISVVLPYEVDELMVRKGEDLCTLVTCTPYGINSHRLLVRGKRVEITEELNAELFPWENDEEDGKDYKEEEKKDSFSGFEQYYLKSVRIGLFFGSLILSGYLFLRNHVRKSA